MPNPDRTDQMKESTRSLRALFNDWQNAETNKDRVLALEAMEHDITALNGFVGAELEELYTDSGDIKPDAD